MQDFSRNFVFLKEQKTRVVDESKRLPHYLKTATSWLSHKNTGKIAFQIQFFLNSFTNLYF